MATSLSRQLLKLKVPESQASRKSLTPSLLFEPKIAATFDKDTFYALGIVVIWYTTSTIQLEFSVVFLN